MKFVILVCFALRNAAVGPSFFSRYTANHSDTLCTIVKWLINAKSPDGYFIGQNKTVLNVRSVKSQYFSYPPLLPPPSIAAAAAPTPWA